MPLDVHLLVAVRNVLTPLEQEDYDDVSDLCCRCEDAWKYEAKECARLWKQLQTRRRARRILLMDFNEAKRQRRVFHRRAKKRLMNRGPVGRAAPAAIADAPVPGNDDAVVLPLVSYDSKENVD